MNPSSAQDAASEKQPLTAPLSKTGADVTSGSPVRANYLWLSGLIIFCATGLDQLTKLWAVRELTGQAPFPVIGEFLRFTLVYNEGGAMGTNFGGALYYLFIGIAIFLVILYYLWIYRSSLRYSIPLALIASGAVGNLVDRVRLGKVVDWIDVDFFNIDIFGYQLDRWWTFNIADASITVALLYMVWAVFSVSSAPAIRPTAEAGDSTGVPSVDPAPETSPAALSAQDNDRTADHKA